MSLETEIRKSIAKSLKKSSANRDAIGVVSTVIQQERDNAIANSNPEEVLTSCLKSRLFLKYLKLDFESYNHRDQAGSILLRNKA